MATVPAPKTGHLRAPWAKGESGNARGNRRGASILAAMRRQLAQRVGTRTRASRIAAQLLKIAEDTEHPHWPQAVRLVLERADPPKHDEVPTTPISVTPVVIQVTVAGQTRRLRELDGAELEEGVRAYLASLPTATVVDEPR